MGSAKVNIHLLNEENHAVLLFLNSPVHCCTVAGFPAETAFNSTQERHFWVKDEEDRSSMGGGQLVLILLSPSLWLGHTLDLHGFRYVLGGQFIFLQWVTLPEASQSWHNLYKLPVFPYDLYKEWNFRSRKIIPSYSMVSVRLKQNHGHKSLSSVRATRLLYGSLGPFQWSEFSSCPWDQSWSRTR